MKCVYQRIRTKDLSESVVGKSIRRDLNAKFTKWIITLFAFVWMALILPWSLQAQEYRGSLQGIVTDPSGALVPNAKIAIKNNATGVVTTVGSSSKGDYTALSLDAGFYTLTVTASGFKTLVRENIEIQTGSKSGLDLALSVGTANVEVVVNTSSPLLNTDTGSGGTVLNQELVEDLPNSGDNVFGLLKYTSGTSHLGVNPDHLSERPFDNGGMDAYSVNGAPYGANNNAFLIDGSPNNNNEGLGFVPSPDAVGQVNAIANFYDSEMGKSAGGVTSVSLKQGANQYHGVGYINVRNDRTDGTLSQNFGQPRQITQWVTWGGQVGGPISIPHLFSGHDKAFFSFSYEHFFDKVPSSQSQSVPSMSQEVGNFCSSAPGNQGIGTVIYDPTTTPRTAFGGCPTGATGSLIPASRIDPVIAGLIQFFPYPTIANCTNPRAPGCVTNFNQIYRHADNYYSDTTRIDYNFTPSEKFFAAYEDGNRLEYIGDPGSPSAAASAIYIPSYTLRINHGASANLTSILSPTLTATSKLNWLRHDGLGRYNGNGPSASQTGISSSFASLFGASNYPGLVFNSTANAPSTQYYNGIGTAGGAQAFGQNLATLSDTWTEQETINKVFGAHSFKVGAGLTELLQNNRTASQAPQIVFGDVFTRQNYTTADGTGDPIASALLGYPAYSSYTSPVSVSWKNTYNFVFFQDDWRLNKKLTVNLGLRWDSVTSPHERYNRAVVGFNPGAPSLAAGVATQTVGPSTTVVNGGGGQYSGGLVYATPDNRSPFNNFYGNFAPRFGFAYSVTTKMVVRGGWGRFFDYSQIYTFPPTTGFSSVSTLNPSTNANQNPLLCSQTPGCVVPSSNPLAGLTANGLASAFPTGLVPITGASLGPKTGAGGAITFLDPNTKPDYTDQFNLGVEYQLPGRLLFHVEYNGSRSSLVPVNRTLNNLTETQYLSQTAASNYNTSVTNPFAGLLPGTTLNSAKVAQSQLLLPYPQYTQVTENALPIGKLWYNALQGRIEKRMSHGLTVQANLTWSKNIGSTTYLNPNYDPITQLTRQPVNIDQPRLENIVMTYKLSNFDHSKSLLVREALSGWTMSGTAQFQVGSLVASPTGVFYTGINPGKVIPGVWNGQSAGRWFNNCVIAANGTSLLASSITAGCPASTPLADAPFQQYPTAAGGFVLNNMPPFFMDNRTVRPPTATLGIFKAFPITERIKFEFRAEAYNLTNTPWFGSGDNSAGITTTATSTSFGVVAPNEGNDPRSIQWTGRLTF